MEAHILLVDDDTVHRALAKEILIDLNYTVSEADNAFAAISKIRQSPQYFDIVLMDWEMFDMDGLQAVRRIRAYQDAEKWPHINVIAFTGHNNPEDKDRCLAAGMDDYIAKEIFLPKWRDSLSQKLEEWLGAERKVVKDVRS